MGTLERLLYDLTWIETVFESILRFGVSQSGRNGILFVELTGKKTVSGNMFCLHYSR